MPPKSRKRVINANQIRGYAPTEQRVTVVIPNEQELAVFKELQKGTDKKTAMKKAGFNLPDKSAERYADQIAEKFNTRLQTAYEKVGLTPEVIAQKHMDVITSGKDADGLKAIDQVLQIQGGYAPKQVDIKHTTFEQAVIEIGQIVNVHGMSQADVKKLLAEDAEFTEITDANTA